MPRIDTMNTPADDGAARAMLAGSVALSGLDEALRDRLCAHFEWITINPGQEIIKEGDSSDFLLAVVSGGLEISKMRKGSPQLVGFARAGSIIGEMGLITSEPRYATCRAAVESQVGLLTRERFQRLRTQDEELYHEFVLFLSGYIAKRLAQVSDMVGALKQQNEIAVQAATRILDTARAT